MSYTSTLANRAAADKLKKLLEVEAREVLCTDPFVSEAELVPLDEAVRKADIVVLGAPHSAYRDLEFPPEKVVIDIWNYWPERRRDAVQPAVAVAAGENRS